MPNALASSLVPSGMSLSHSGRVFIVDDDPAVRDSLALLLRSQGWDARSHASADAFLAEYRPGSADCLVLDLQMPGMNGVELQEELDRRGIAIPVIIITAFARDPLAARARAVGARAVIAKPFRHEVLLQSIEKALEGSSTGRAPA